MNSSNNSEKHHVNVLRTSVHKKRIEMGIIAREAAKQIGVSYPSYNRFIAGIVIPREVNMHKYVMWLKRKNEMN